MRAAHLVGLLLCFMWQGVAMAAEVVVRGNVEIDAATILQYVALDEEITVDDAAIRAAIEDLYRTQLFTEIAIFEEAGTFIIEVVERPFIESIEVEGNTLIDTDAILENLRVQNIASNRPFNAGTLEKISQELSSQYYLQGYYGARVVGEAETVAERRVKLNIRIIEGEVSKIVRINFIGNTVYAEEDLRRLLVLREAYPQVPFNNNDRYVRASLEGDQTRVRDFYQNQGYARFKIVEQKVALSPNREGVYISFQLDEGARYKFAGSKIVGHQEILTEDAVAALNAVEEGDWFSRDAISETVERIQRALWAKGYAFASVFPNVKIDDARKTVFVRFEVLPQNRVYVRRIVSYGNTFTLDAVIRREFRMMEQALFRPHLLQRSETRLNRLGFFSSVSVDSRRVNNHQVDIIVRVNEGRTASVNGQLGYSTLNEVELSFSLSDNNFFGWGNQVNISVNGSKARREASLGIVDPYFTANNVSLANSITYREYDADALNIGSYSMNRTEVQSRFGVPISERERVNYGISVGQYTLTCNDAFLVCTRYVGEHGKTQQDISLSVSFNYDTRNQFFFATEGWNNRLRAQSAVPSVGLQYYELSGEGNYHVGLLGQAVRLRAESSVVGGFNGDEVSFFNRRYSNVRGYVGNSLGPRYDAVLDGSSDTKGGRLTVGTSVDVFFRIAREDEFSREQDNMRFVWFLDAGNAFDTVEAFDADAIRATSGLGFLYWSAIGPISIYYAVPLNERMGDNTRTFNFLLGQTF